jgi:hypothetical protein
MNTNQIISPIINYFFTSSPLRVSSFFSSPLGASFSLFKAALATPNEALSKTKGLAFSALPELSFS